MSRDHVQLTSCEADGVANEENFDEFDEDDRFRVHCAAPSQTEEPAEQKIVDEEDFDEFDEDDRFRVHCHTGELAEGDLKVLDFDECDEEARLAVHNATVESEPTNGPDVQHRDEAKTDDASQRSDNFPYSRPAIYFGAWEGPPDEAPAEAAHRTAERSTPEEAWTPPEEARTPPEESEQEEARLPPARPKPRLDPYAAALEAAKDHVAHAKAAAAGTAMRADGRVGPRLQPAAPPPPSALVETRAEAGADVAAATGEAAMGAAAKGAAEEEVEAQEEVAAQEEVVAQRGGARRPAGLSACSNTRSGASASSSASASAPSPSRSKGADGKSKDGKSKDGKSAASNSTLSLQSALLSRTVRRGTWCGVSATRSGDATGDVAAEAEAAEPAGAAAPLDGNVEGASAALMRQTTERFRSRLLEAERKGSDAAGAAARRGAATGPPLDSLLCADDVVRAIPPTCYTPLCATPPYVPHPLTCHTPHQPHPSPATHPY